MDEGQALGVGEGAGRGIGFDQVMTLKDHAGAEIAGVLDLGEGGGQRHDDGGGNAQAPGVIGDALGMVARAHRRDAAFLFVRRQGQQAVQRPALLEGGGELAVLEFQPDFAAGDAREGQGAAGGGADKRAAHGAGGGLHIVEGDGQGGHGRPVDKAWTGRWPKCG